MLAAGVALAALLVLNWDVPEGTLVVQVNEPGARVSVADGKFTFTVPSSGKPIEVTLVPGKHQLQVMKDGFETQTINFTVSDSDREIIQVTLVPISSGQPKAPPRAKDARRRKRAR
ncbi:MAG: PEGA domain-containing protein [Planctomycetales bacterium]